jgi:hypothetical protein
MKLGDILRGATMRPSVTRPVTFKVRCENPDGVVVDGLAKAVFLAVPEDQRTEALFEAQAALEKRFPGKAPPAGVAGDEEAYHLLFRALHDAEPRANGTYARFADTVTELRNALVLPVVQRLYAEYHAFVASEYPPMVPDEEFDKLVEEAKKNSMADLLSSYGFERCAALLSSLAVRSRK